MSALAGARGGSAGRSGLFAALGSASPARAHSRGVDGVLFAAIVALIAVGTLAVYTASAPISLDRFGTPHHHVLRHLLHLVIGVVVMTLLARMDVRRLDHPVVVHALWAVTIVLLFACFFEDPVGGARRWIRAGGLSFQPSELAKLAVVLVGAFQLSRRSDRLGDPWHGVLPPALLCGWLSVLVALQPDFGTAAILVMLLGMSCLAAGTPWRVLLGYGTAATVTMGLYLVQEPYRVARLQTFLDPSADPQGSGFQLRQSLIALGTGGLVGRSHDGMLGSGLGTSLQKLFFLPEPHTDFVLAVFGEELGLLGTLTVAALFCVVLIRGLRISAAASTPFGSLVAVGCTAMISLQALVNVLVVVGLLPTKGVPLPFLSAGGSSLVVSCAAAGLLMSVSRHD